MVKPSTKKKRDEKRPRHAKNQPLKGDKGLFALRSKLEKEINK